MTKREVSEILRGLKECANTTREDACELCPYSSHTDCIARLAKDASVVLEALLPLAGDGDAESRHTAPVMTELTRPPIPPRKVKLTAAETNFEELDRMMRGNCYKRPQEATDERTE